MMVNAKQHIGLLTLILLLVAVHPASAQRTLSGQSALGLSARYNGTSVGAEAFFSQYTLNGYWQAGITGDLFDVPLSAGVEMDYLDVSLKGGYAYRLTGARSRSVNLYGGGGVFAGVEWMDPEIKLPGYIDIGLPSVVFLYGIYARAMVEVFMGTRMALTLSGEVPVNFSSKITMLHWGVLAGIKILL